jgi:anti-anti-sigma regulatory factor
MTGVDYINGAGLRAFETAAARFNGSKGELIVCGLQPAVQAAFRLAGSIAHVTTVPSRGDALRRFTEPDSQPPNGSSRSD